MKYAKSFFSENILRAAEMGDTEWANTLVKIYGMMKEHELRKRSERGEANLRAPVRERSEPSNTGTTGEAFDVSYRAALARAGVTRQRD